MDKQDKKQKKSLKQIRAAARATLKSHRSTASSALDAYSFTENNDIYDDVYDEDEYRRLVEKERAKEDFVVDDGAFLYFFARVMYFFEIDVSCHVMCSIFIM